MVNLTEREYWDAGYQARDYGAHAPRVKIERVLGAVFGQRFLEYTRSYSEFLEESILREHVPAPARAKVLEIGSAPGHYLVKLHRQRGWDPYGVEYAEAGAESNRAVFELNCISPDHVIHADFFSDEFHERFRESFDIVVSRGFIEHFTNVDEVIDKHLSLLRPGGTLIITIPNYNRLGFYCTWFRLFRREAIAMHNLTIMRWGNFTRLFARSDLATLVCRHVGTFSLAMLGASKRSPMRLVVALGVQFQVFLNLLFRAILGSRSAESAVFSPFLMFIGRKRE